MSGSSAAVLQKSLALVADQPYARIDKRGAEYALRVGYWDSRPEALQAAKALLPKFRDAYARIASYRPDAIVARAGEQPSAASAPVTSTPEVPATGAAGAAKKPAQASASVSSTPALASVVEQPSQSPAPIPSAPTIQPSSVAGAAEQPSKMSASAPVTPVISPPTTESVQSLEILRSQLAARQAINEQLSKRIETLEKQLAAQSKIDGPPILGLDANSPKPVADTAKPDSITAIEEALVSKGLVLMSAGSLRGALSASWGHNGTGSNRADSYSVGTTFEAGLPWGMAAALSVPYIWRDSSDGTNNGVGDPSISVAKKLSNESDSLPSFVARLSYTHDGGKDPFTLPAIGSGFRSYGVSLSAVKRSDPVVFYGNLSYAHALPKMAVVRFKDSGNILFQGKIAPGDSYGLGMGVSLTATPEIALDAGLSLAFANSSRLELLNTAFYPGRATVGYFNLGTSILLTKNMSLSVNASAGVTKDASDFIFSVALPYRFW